MYIKTLAAPLILSLISYSAFARTADEHITREISTEPAECVVLYLTGEVKLEADSIAVVEPTKTIHDTKHKHKTKNQ